MVNNNQSGISEVDAKWASDRLTSAVMYGAKIALNPHGPSYWVAMANNGNGWVPCSSLLTENGKNIMVKWLKTLLDISVVPMTECKN